MEKRLDKASRWCYNRQAVSWSWGLSKVFVELILGKIKFSKNFKKRLDKGLRWWYNKQAVSESWKENGFRVHMLGNKKKRKKFSKKLDKVSRRWYNKNPLPERAGAEPWELNSAGSWRVLTFRCLSILKVGNLRNKKQ